MSGVYKANNVKNHSYNNLIPRGVLLGAYYWPQKKDQRPEPYNLYQRFTEFGCTNHRASGGSCTPWGGGGSLPTQKNVGIGKSLGKYSVHVLGNSPHRYLSPSGWGSATPEMTKTPPGSCDGPHPLRTRSTPVNLTAKKLPARDRCSRRSGRSSPGPSSAGAAGGGGRLQWECHSHTYACLCVMHTGSAWVDSQQSRSGFGAGPGVQSGLVVKSGRPPPPTNHSPAQGNIFRRRKRRRNLT